MSNLGTRLRGLAATLALVAFVVGTPVVLLAIAAVPSPSAFSWSRLTSPDDGTLALEMIAVIAWVGWAIFTYSVLAALAAQAQGIRAPRIHGLGMPQLAADRLVAAAALLFVAIPTASTVLPPPRADAVVAASPLPVEHVPVASASSAAQPVVVHKDPAPRTDSYTVKRGDSLWRIAEERLGDGTRYVELVELNSAVLNGQPDFLRPGIVLRVPADEMGVDSQYVVQPGDTLSEIAEDELGDASAYPVIFEASRDTVQSNGAHLTDPDLILPGWTLTVPRSPGQKPRKPEPDKERAPEVAPEPDPPAQAQPPTAAPEAAEPEPAAADGAEHVIPAWLLPGLAGSSAVLGAALWLVLRAHRRTQLRYRRPGTIIAPPPPELREAEKTLHVTASLVAHKVEALDAALRSLGPAPRLLSVALGDEHIELTLAKPTDLTTPWIGGGRRWRAHLDDLPTTADGTLAPYPTLVSIGQAADTSLVLVNLEELKTVTITGDADRTTALARHLIAEMVVNPWASPVHVDAVGIGAEMTSLNSDFFHVHEPGDTTFLESLREELESANASVEPDEFHVAVVDAGQGREQAAKLASAIEGFNGRSGLVLVDLDKEPSTAGVEIQVSGRGELTVSSLALRLIASGLSAAEAEACAALVEVTRDASVVPVPPPPQPAVSDAAGGLVERLTDPRPINGPAGDDSLLPLAASVYADVAATTPEDIETLAPVASKVAEAEVRSADPDLDEDLARWESPMPVAPKVTVLGPVSARTLGDATATAHRRPYYVEFLAYLALHPRGVTADQLAEDLCIRPHRARTDLSIVRRWLGQDRSGKQFLPRAQQTHVEGVGATYALDGVLTDVDLFRRLRVRGQSRGAAGMDDLVAALRLVSGEPFTDLRKDGWGWLLEGDRLDQIMTAAIVDVAHIVTTHALAAGDLDLADFATQVGLVASPYDEVAALDRAEVERARGDITAADARVRRDVFNRSDDTFGPIDLPPRTSKVAAGKSWVSGRRHTG